MTQITFSQSADSKGNPCEAAEFVSTGEPIGVHIQREKEGNLNFRARIGTLPNASMRNGSFSSNEAGKVFFTTLPLVPEGVTVRIESFSHVVACNISIDISA